MHFTLSPEHANVVLDGFHNESIDRVLTALAMANFAMRSVPVEGVDGDASPLTPQEARRFVVGNRMSMVAHRGRVALLSVSATCEGRGYRLDFVPPDVHFGPLIKRAVDILGDDLDLEEVEPDAEVIEISSIAREFERSARTG